MHKVLPILGGILFLGVGGAIGWFAARHYYLPEPAPDSGKPTISFRIGDQELRQPVPAWETWQYPDSKVESSSTGGGTTSGGLEFGASERIALVTPDGFDKVWAFYKEKCQLRELGDGSETNRLNVVGSDKGATITVFDDVQAHSFAGPKSDLLNCRAFTVHSLRYQLTGFVYRPKDAASTCILLAYRPNKEFVGLLKDRALPK